MRGVWAPAGAKAWSPSAQATQKVPTELDLNKISKLNIIISTGEKSWRSPCVQEFGFGFASRIAQLDDKLVNSTSLSRAEVSLGGGLFPLQAIGIPTFGLRLPNNFLFRKFIRSTAPLAVFVPPSQPLSKYHVVINAGALAFANPVSGSQSQNYEIT